MPPSEFIFIVAGLNMLMLYSASPSSLIAGILRGAATYAILLTSSPVLFLEVSLRWIPLVCIDIWDEFEGVGPPTGIFLKSFIGLSTIFSGSTCLIICVCFLNSKMIFATISCYSPRIWF